MSLADIQAMKALKIANQNSKYIGNLFNPFAINNGFFLNGGTLAASASYATSDFISVIPNTQYLCTDVRFLEFYDSNKTLLNSNISYNPSRQNLLIRAISGSAYVRITSTPANMQSGNYWFVPVKAPTKWLGKIWSALGDSITAGNMWQPYVQDQLGLSMFNYGVAGTKVADTTGSDTTAMCRDERINLMNAGSNLITVMGGTNDWVQNVSLGSISDTVTTSYYGALNVMIQKIITRYPTARLVLITPPYGLEPNRAGWTDTTGLKNNLNLTSGDYGNAMIQVARLYGVPVIDAYGNCGWNSINIATYLNNDGAYLHPNDTGGRRLGEVVSGFLKRIEPTA